MHNAEVGLKRRLDFRCVLLFLCKNLPNLCTHLKLEILKVLDKVVFFLAESWLGVKQDFAVGGNMSF